MIMKNLCALFPYSVVFLNGYIRIFAFIDQCLQGFEKLQQINKKYESGTNLDTVLIRFFMAFFHDWLKSAKNEFYCQNYTDF